MKAWAAAANAGELVPVETGSASGAWRAALVLVDIEERLACASAPTLRLRIPNPFDPGIRDRNGLKRLFGFGWNPG